MKTPLRSLRLRRGIAWLLMASMTLTHSVQVAALTLATSPLAATTTSVVRPNLMYVLDDSGSMGWDFTPDYVNDSAVSDPAAVDPVTGLRFGLPGSSGDTGIPTLSGGVITGITAVGGNLYYEAPAVVIEGGGGTGAVATATWNSSTKKITAVVVGSGGSGYTSVPYVTFVGRLTSAAWGMCWGTTGTNNQGGTPKDTSAPSPACTSMTQPPYATAAVNYQYYDPAVRYEVPRKAAWTSNCVAGSATCYYPAATPTAASSDGFLGGTTKNLTNAWTHEVWCNSSSASPSAADPTAAGKCRENLDSSNNVLYPNAIFTFRKTYSGPAFYYTMGPSEYCTDDNYTSCVRSTAPTVVGPTTFNVPSRYRWCSYYNPQTHAFGGCQGRRDWSHYIPNYLGGWVSTGAAGVQATATLTINSVPVPPATQSMTGLTIGGVDVIGGAIITTNAASTTTTVAQAVCSAIQAQTGSTGYGCAATGGNVLIQAAMVGTAANGLQVLASGPPDGAAVNSIGELPVTSTHTGYTIDSISITHTDGSGTAQLVNGPVVATGDCGWNGADCGSQAQLVCERINSGPSQGLYVARSGDPAGLPGWGTCQSHVSARIFIQRIPADTVDNNVPIVVTGPAIATISTGTITVNATGGATRLSDITMSAFGSILSSKPLDYADGTQTSAIAADIASKISAYIATSNCAATASGNVVSITGSTPCTGVLAYAPAGTSASGVFRVSSTGSTNAASLGGIQVNTANIVGTVTSAQITDGTAVAANAATLRAQINNGTSILSNGVGPHGFTAAAPVAGGGTYDVTVTAPAGNSYNGMSFTFLGGTASAGGAGSQPQWTFPITGATADNAHITSITCGGTTAVPDRNTGNTSSATNYIQNLTVNTASPTYGLNGKTDAGGLGYSYACSALTAPQYRCTVTGPAGAAVCSNLSITKDASITLSTTSPAAVGGGGGSKSWQVIFNNATADAKDISSIKCDTDSGPQMLNSTVSTGTATSTDYASTLASAINTQSSNQNGWNGTSGCTSSGTTVSCGFQRDSGAGNRCGSVTISKSGTTLLPGIVAESWNSGRYTYSFNITNVTAGGESINQVTCNSGGNQESLSSTATRQWLDDTGEFADRINDASAGQNGWNGISGCYRVASGHIRCAFERDDGAARQCTGGVTPTGSGVTFGGVTESWDETRYKYTFDITNAGDTNDKVSSVICTTAATTQDSMASIASTGAASDTSAVQRLNMIRSGLNGQSKVSTDGTFTWSCPTAATNGSPTLTCTASSSDTSCTSSNLRIRGSNNTGVYISGSASQIDNATHSYTAAYSVGGGTSPTWTFDIQNATADSKSISAINCGATSILPSNAPNTGTVPVSTDWQRINNLTGSDGITAGTVGPTNGYTLVCPQATASATQPDCILTGPSGPGACNGTSLTFNKDSSIGIGTATFTDGVAAGSPVDNFFSIEGSYLSTASPFSAGRLPQGATAFGFTTVNVGPISITPGNMGVGTAANTLAIQTNATGALTMSGGQELDTATNHWTDLGVFKRVDVVATNNTYSRASGRTDCAGATCTYNEEMQNFANWYTYYRTRMQMMKSATSIAFSQLDGNYRVGYDNICLPTGTTVRRGVGQFVDTGGETVNQRTNWWNDLVTESPSCATPLRAETAKIGKYYSGKLTASGDPLQYSCQQNFTMLVTDGYWNESEPSSTSILGTDVGNVDNSAATSPRPYYDGAQSSTACPATGSGRGGTASSCRTLADITRYYYQTDLRSSAKEVLVTTAANHGLSPGLQVTISGVVSTPPADDLNATFNGDVVAYVTGPTTFRYVPVNDLIVNPTNDPGTYGSGGSITVNGTAVGFSSVSVTSGLFGNATNTAGTDVATNNVMTGADDSNGHQHMNFYAMGLGIDGTLEYRSDYQTATTGDYHDIVGGTRDWPAVANLDPTGVDDLWHATANGHGKYFSARNLPNVVAGLREALTKIGSRVGSASAAATSNLQPVSGDNFAYVGSYGTQDWVGDLQSRSIDLLSGAVSSSAACSPGATPGCQWSLQAKLDNMTWSARRIYVKPVAGVTGDPLRVFNWGNLTGAEQAWFNPGSLSQYTVLSVSNASDITGENLVDFLRGQRNLEQDGDVSHAQIWRDRAHVLGDIVNTQPIYMKAPSRNYSDAGYSTFKQTGAAATRKPVVFISSQDGFMHAINANTPNPAIVGDTGAVTIGAATVRPGEELWAYIPTQAMQNMKALADINYSFHHQYFVDGPITVGDVNFGGGDSDWHTIVVGGHGAGGTAYFALDVTDPLNPKFLWEFTNTNLGYSFSNPVVTKLPNGEWAVLFTSGYNNNSGGGDGVGRLYAVDPKTGSIKTGFPMDTGSGSVGTPSNLGKISVWVDNALNNNTAKFIYAGDTNGDLWRFDFDPGATGHSGAAVFKLAQLTDPGGVGMPITTKPELTTVVTSSHGVVPIVLVGTGQYLDTADLTNTDVQSFYAIKDTLGADNLGGGAQETYIPRTASKLGVPMFLKRKLISTKEGGTKIKYTDEYGQLVDGRMVCPVGINGAQPTVTAGGSCKPGIDAGGTPEATPTMDWETYGGWMVDLPDPGERLNVDPKLDKGTIVFATNVPSASACTSAGSAYANFLDYSTGLAVAGQTIASRRVSNALVVGLTVITLPSGESKVIVTRSDAKQDTYKVPVQTTSSSVFQNKRSLWREFEAY